MNIEDAKKKLDDANAEKITIALTQQHLEMNNEYHIKMNFNLLAENDRLKTNNEILMAQVQRFEDENDALMLEKIRLMDTNMRLITEIEAYNVYVLNNAKVGVK